MWSPSSGKGWALEPYPTEKTHNNSWIGLEMGIFFLHFIGSHFKGEITKQFSFHLVPHFEDQGQSDYKWNELNCFTKELFGGLRA
jgi:hypothetical protein